MMKRYIPLLCLFLLLLAFLSVFYTRMPAADYGNAAPDSGFSTERALEHVRQMSLQPHAVGFPAHEEVRNYLLGELSSLGLQPVIQQGYTAGDWANLSRASNILARIEGSGNGKALLLLSHYDSNPHSSFGASDAASGVATILEVIRAYLAEGKKPVNDIIILFSDAEELGLNGADLFVNQHPWAKDVGIVLNFEARGSGGPSYMFLETNGGNSALIKGFMDASPKYPNANSLAYSVYKLLPNDTDLTVFREDGDIQGYNFAFIDDHYDYHTALDRFDRLDPESLAHQGSYLYPLLDYFATEDLATYSSESDIVFVAIPLMGLVTYPYSWIWPLFFLALFIFIGLMIYGFSLSVLQWKEIAKGFIPMLVSLAGTLLVGYFGWQVILEFYPGYRDMLHGFTYNGHWYIASMASLSAAICFWVYHKSGRISLANQLPAVIFFWLLLCAGLSYYLAGAAFFILPVIALLGGFLIILHPRHIDRVLLALLGIPAIWILSPFIEMLPIGLGLKLLITTTLFTNLLFFLLLPILGALKIHRKLGVLSLLLGLGMLAAAHFQADFNSDQPHPSSLVYLLNSEDDIAYWATYNKSLTSWNKSYFTPDQLTANDGIPIFPSKYQTGFTQVSKAPLKDLASPEIVKQKDTVVDGNRELSILYRPQRDVNRLDIYTSNTPLQSVKANGVSLGKNFMQNRGSRLLTHYISENDVTQLDIRLSEGTALELVFFETSNNLLTHPEFSVPPRPGDEIPMPFVLNDAVVIMKRVRYE